MAQSDKELLDSIQQEAGQMREDSSQVKSGLVRKGEITEPDKGEQDIKTEEQPDEELEPEKENEPDEVEDGPEPAPKRGNREAALERILQREREKSAKMEQEFKEKLTALENVKTERERKEITDDIGQFVAELNEGRDPQYQTDTATMEKILNKAADIAERRLAGKLPPEAMFRDYEEREESQYFDEEFESPELQDYLTVTYPNATARQLTEAKALLDEIAHSEEGGKVITVNGQERLQGYPLDYLMMKNKSQFDSILSSKKRHGLEDTTRSGFDAVSEERDTSSARGIDALDKRYREAEAEGSSLHRARPSDRFI